MKKENSIVIGLSIIFTIIIISIFTKNYLGYKNDSTISNTPFIQVEILNQKIRLKENIRTYKTKIECDSLNKNEQIIYYRLKEKYKSYKIKATSKIFKKNKLLTDSYKGATNIDINLSITDPKEQYEQIYHLEATCLDNKKEEKEQE